jgi:hypothetical protein
MRTLVYRNGDWREQPHGIEPPQSGQEEFKTINGNSNTDRLRLTQLLLDGTHYGYNKALQLYQNSDASIGSFGMSYLNHAKQLSSSDFPNHWSEPEFQAYLPQEISNNTLLLLCFTGVGQGLNMPIPCFHSIAKHVFDGIVYFFDVQKDYYTANQAQVEQAVARLLELSSWQRVALIGASGGGSITLRFPSHPLVKKRLSASPPICRDQQVLNLIKRRKFENFRKSRIFFAVGNKIDTRHYRHLKSHLPTELFDQSVFNLAWASESHGTLATLLQLGALSKQLEWLGNDT